jgi:hypothetical protein
MFGSPSVTSGAPTHVYGVKLRHRNELKEKCPTNYAGQMQKIAHMDKEAYVLNGRVVGINCAGSAGL